MKIVVLAGGISTEREVSIVSGTNVCRALRSMGEDAVILDVYFGNTDLYPGNAFGNTKYNLEAEVEKIKACSARIEDEQKKNREFFGPNVIALCQAADIVFLALHGENGENGKVQAAFDLMNIRYTGTGHISSAIAMDKGLAKTVLAGNQVPVPKGIVLTRESEKKALTDYSMDYPVVVKPCCGGSSVGVFIAKNEDEYEKALKEAFSYEDEIVVEDYIHGREFSVGVIDGKAYPIIEISPLEGFYDYKNKYTAGATVETCPAKLSEEKTLEMQLYAVKGTRALMIESYVRFDFLMDEAGKIYCLEANTLPGMTPTSLLPQEAKAMGIDYPNLCKLLIDCSLKRYEK